MNAAHENEPSPLDLDERDARRPEPSEMEWRRLIELAPELDETPRAPATLTIFYPPIPREVYLTRHDWVFTRIMRAVLEMEERLRFTGWRHDYKRCKTRINREKGTCHPETVMVWREDAR